MPANAAHSQKLKNKINTIWKFYNKPFERFVIFNVSPLNSS